eukprot:6393471-Alexandrium_andersonii.AAC.1
MLGTATYVAEAALQGSADFARGTAEDLAGGSRYAMEPELPARERPAEGPALQDQRGIVKVRAGRSALGA